MSRAAAVRAVHGGLTDALGVVIFAVDIYFLTSFVVGPSWVHAQLKKKTS
jgi:hypothetical protein